MDLGLKDKVVIVTGGAKGIGAGMVESFASEGAFVYSVNRPSEEGEALAKRLCTEGKDVTFVPAELNDPEESRKVITRVLQERGEIYCIMNNAGYNDEKNLDTPPTEFMQSVSNNLIHYYAMVHYAKDALIASKGSVVNTGSHVSITGQGGTSAYVAAKGAICGLTREWAAYFSKFGVRVNCVVPGSVWTNAYVKWANKFPDPEARRRMAEQNIPLGRRMTTIEEFADFAVYIASPRASHLTGEIIINDGGYSRLDRVLT